jgi:hypothetical protein
MRSAVTSAQPRWVLATATGGTVITIENGAYTWDGRTLDEVEDNLYEPGAGVVIAVLVVASAAVVFASLPAAVGVGLLAMRPEQLAAAIAGLAVGICGVLGAVKLVAVAWETGHRLRSRRPARSIATSAD